MGSALESPEAPVWAVVGALVLIAVVGIVGQRYRLNSVAYGGAATLIALLVGLAALNTQAWIIAIVGFVGVVAIGAQVYSGYIEDRTAEERHAANQDRHSSTGVAIDALQRAAESRARRDTVRRTDEMIQRLHGLIEPYTLVRDKHNSDPQDAEAARQRSAVQAAILARYASEFAVPVGLIFLEYRDEYGVKIDEASAIIQEVTAVEQVIRLVNMLTVMGADLLFAKAST